MMGGSTAAATADAEGLRQQLAASHAPRAEWVTRRSCGDLERREAEVVGQAWWASKSEKAAAAWPRIVCSAQLAIDRERARRPRGPRAEIVMRRERTARGVSGSSL